MSPAASPSPQMHENKSPQNQTSESQTQQNATLPLRTAFHGSSKITKTSPTRKRNTPAALNLSSTSTPKSRSGFTATRSPLPEIVVSPAPNTARDVTGIRIGRESATARFMVPATSVENERGNRFLQVVLDVMDDDRIVEKGGSEGDEGELEEGEIVEDVVSKK